jgi:alkylation response protein AidB-like acyl-CoA dehydrogenase
MSFVLGRTEEQQLLGDTLERLGAKLNEFEARRRRLMVTSPDRMALWPHLADVGAFGLVFGEAQGGFGGSATDIAVLVEALAPCLPVEPIIPSLITAGRVLSAARGERVAALIAGLIEGSRVPVLAHTEGFDPFAPPRLVSARPSGNGYVLEGTKPAVRGADVASDILVSAVLPDGTVGVFAVSRHASGLIREPIRMIDGAGGADLTLKEVTVEADDLLPQDHALAAIGEAHEWSLMALAVETASLARAANRATFDYLNIRQQFGQALARFQALQHKAADMAVAQTEAEAVASRSIWLLADTPSAERQRTLLHASLASDAAGRVIGHSAIQLHGGMGVSDELVISHYARRLAAIRTQIATADARQARLLQLKERAQ